MVKKVICINLLILLISIFLLTTCKKSPTSTPDTNDEPITLTYPNGGETWDKGNTYTILWENNSIVGEIRICLHGGGKDNAGGWFLAGQVDADDESLPYTVPVNYGYPVDNEVVIMKSLEWERLDESDDYFTVD